MSDLPTEPIPDPPGETIMQAEERQILWRIADQCKRMINRHGTTGNKRLQEISDMLDRLDEITDAP